MTTTGDRTKLSVVILDGQSSHGWPDLTAAVRASLTATGRFEVTVSTSPVRDADDGEWERWQPELAGCDAVIINHEGRGWPSALRDRFEQFVRSGGGAVVLHSCVGGQQGWQPYLEMIGLGWRAAWEGDHLFYDDQGELVRTPPFLGVGAGHGKQHTYRVMNRCPDHPIMKDVPPVFMHGMDELYHGMRGPARNLTVLASAYSAKDQWGSGDHDPMLWTTRYGEGRVATTVLGHRWYGDERGAPGSVSECGPDAVHCVGYQTLVARSVEWAASEAVTLPVAAPFPGSDVPSIVDPAQVDWDGTA